MQDCELLVQLFILIHRLKKIQEKKKKIKDSKEVLRLLQKDADIQAEERAANMLEDAQDEEIVFD